MRGLHSSTKQSGFTLVELIVVIVILGILAATALPKFINVSTQANNASLNGLAGGLRSAVTVVQARHFAENDGNTSVDMVGGGTVDVAAATGIPNATATGIVAAMQSTDGFTATHAAGVTTFNFDTAIAGCTVTYTQATGAVAVNTATGCN